MIILKSLNYINSRGGGFTLYIEEPEAHLFPTAQKRIIQLLSRTFNNNNNKKFQIFVTTHRHVDLMKDVFYNSIKFEKVGNFTEISPE